MSKVGRNEARVRRHKRVRSRVFGTLERPRLNVFRSLNHIYAQVIDDQTGTTLVAASTLDPRLKGTLTATDNKEAAKEVGALVGKKALDKGIKTVVFDRGGFKYHGRVAAVAEGAREAGLEF